MPDSPTSPSFQRFARQIVAGLAGLHGNVVAIEGLESTNTLARRFAVDCLKEGSRVPRTLLCAYWQWGGRGRRGNSWVSDAGVGVYGTLLWQFAERSSLLLLPMQVAVALAEGVAELVGEARCRLKWPNDLMIDGRKLGGILIEAVHGEDGECVVAIGFGINYSQASDELPTPGSTSLRLAGAAESELGTVAAHLARHLIGALESPLPHQQLIGRFAALSQHQTGEELCVLTGEERVVGRFRGFDERGFLRLETLHGVRAVGSGEVIEE